MKEDPESREYTLEFLLGFDRRVHWYEDGCHIRFRLRRVPPSPERPHGLRYSFTLHDPEGLRIMGFDNAHPVGSVGPRFGSKPGIADHWHRSRGDKGRPYIFQDAETLIEDFFNEVSRILTERGVSTEVVAVDDGGG